MRDLLRHRQPRRWPQSALTVLLLLALVAFATAQTPAPAPRAEGEPLTREEVISTESLKDMMPAQLYSLGLRLLTQGNYAKAGAVLEFYLETAKKFPELAESITVEIAWVNLGLCKLETGQRNEAVDLLEKFLRKFPASTQRQNAYLLLADTLVAEEMWERLVQVGGELKKITDSKHAARTFSSNLLVSEWVSAYQLIGLGNYRLERWAEVLAPFSYVFQNSSEMSAKAEAAAILTVACAKLNKFKDMFNFLRAVYQTPVRFDPKLNQMLAETADKYYEDRRHSRALMLYRMVHSRGETLNEVDKRIAEINEALALLPHRPEISQAQKRTERRRLERLLADFQEQRKLYQDRPEHAPLINLRIAQTYAQLFRHWEALWLFRSVYDTWSEHEVAPTALYLAFTSAVQLEEVDYALWCGYEFLRVYPKHQFADAITLLLTQYHVQRQEFRSALHVANLGLTESPQHPNRDQMLFLRGFCYFSLEKFDNALADFREVIEKHPEAQYRDGAEFFHACTQQFLGKFLESAAELEAFIKRYEGGQYDEDAHFRLGVAYFSGREFDKAALIMEQFFGRFPQSIYRSEALVMTGDYYGSIGKLKRAEQLYLQARDSAQQAAAASYACLQAARIYEMQGRWEDIIKLFRGYLEKHGEQGHFTEAYYHIATAQAHLGQQQAAQQTFFDAIIRHGNVPVHYGVDMIMRDMIFDRTLGGRRQDINEFLGRLFKELDRVRGDEKQRTLYLRLVTLMAETTLDEARRKTMYDALVSEANVAPAGPLTLSVIGREAAKRGEHDLARKAFTSFVTNYRNCELAVYALAGMAEVELRDGKPAQAIPLLQEVTQRFATLPEAGEAQKRIGDAYRELKQYTQAIVAYNVVFANREWRGPLWAEALYWIGVCNLEQNRPDEAFAYFQRVYVMYDGFAEWAAKAYLKSAVCLEKLNKRPEAIKTYRELLAAEHLAQQPEIAEARKELARLEGQP